MASHDLDVLVCIFQPYPSSHPCLCLDLSFLLALAFLRTHPLGLMSTPLVNLPVFLMFVWSIRGMLRDASIPGLDTGGFLFLRFRPFHFCVLVMFSLSHD